MPKKTIRANRIKGNFVYTVNNAKKGGGKNGIKILRRGQATSI